MRVSVHRRAFKEPSRADTSQELIVHFTQERGRRSLLILCTCDLTIVDAFVISIVVAMTMGIVMVVFRDAAGFCHIIFVLFLRRRAIALRFLSLPSGVLTHGLERRDIAKFFNYSTRCCWATREHNFLLIYGDRCTDKKLSNVMREPLVEASFHQSLLDFCTALLKGSVVVKVFYVLVV